MPGKLTTHVLDTTQGIPARGMKIELWSLTGAEKVLCKTVRTNADGRIDAPLLTAEEIQIGEYELLFFVGDYFSTTASSFLQCVPMRFSIHDKEASYHVPLLCSPFSYSTYRGS